MLEATDTIVVPKVINYIDVYKEASTSSEVVGRMYRGTGAYRIRRKGNFSYISSGNIIGWIENRILTTGKSARAFVKEMVPQVATVKKEDTVVRKTASSSGKKLVTLPKGHQMIVLSLTDNWAKVRLAKYDVGYISRKSLKIEKGLFPGATIAEEKKVEAWIEDGRWSEKSEKQDEESEKQNEETEDKTDPQEDSDDKEKEVLQEGNWKSLGEFKLTAYCPCAKCNGSSNAGKTATGVKPTANHTIAVDRKVIPLGSKIRIGDSDIVYVAEDTGVRGNHIDIFHDTHSQALDFGVARREVFILTEE